MLTNIQKLQDAYRQIGWLKEHENSREETKNIVEYTQRMITEFITDNQPKPKNKFNIWAYTANDERRPVLNGVFHDKENKMAAATDAHILIADAASYDESKTDTAIDNKTWLGRRSVDKYGNFIDGRYPDYTKVVPEITENYQKVTIDINEINTLIQKHKTWLRLNGYTGKRRKPSCIYLVKNVCFNIYYLQAFLKASNGEIYITSPDKAGVFRNKNRMGILMPILYTPEKVQKIDDMLLLETW